MTHERRRRSFGMQRLPFQLHRFTRVTWTSQQARKVWQPRFQRIQDARQQLVYPIITDSAGQAYRLSLKRVYFHQLEALRAELRQYQLSVERIDRSAEALSFFYPTAFAPDDRLAFVLIGQAEDIEGAIRAIDTQNFSQFHHAFRLPECCIQFSQDVKQAGLSDPTWPSIVNASSQAQCLNDSDDGDISDCDSCDIKGPPQTNSLLSCLKLCLLRHAPCHSECRACIRMAETVADIGKHRGFADEIEWLQQILAWPMSWSALHGIAEIKTPIMKVIYNTDATAVAYQCRRQGSVFPQEGAQGLGFPYKQPAHFAFSQSAGFRRGLDHARQS